MKKSLTEKIFKIVILWITMILTLVLICMGANMKFIALAFILIAYTALLCTTVGLLSLREFYIYSGARFIDTVLNRTLNK
jgi:hypothetical protein